MSLRWQFIVHCLAALTVLTSCGAGVGSSADPLAGRYKVKGGGAALDVFQGLSDAFRKQHPTVRFDFEDVGSAAGMKLAASGDVDLATSSAVPPPDIATLVTAVPVGSTGTAVIVNAANPVTSLTKTQVRDIFSGTIVDWSAVGGPPAKIAVVIREVTSALRGNFDAYFFGGKGTYRADAIDLNTGDDVIRAVTSRTEVISMITMSQSVLSDQRIRAVAIDGVAPTKENIVAGRYPVVRPLFLVYSEKHLKPAIAAFLDFVRSAEGRRIIDSVTSGG